MMMKSLKIRMFGLLLAMVATNAVYAQSSETVLEKLSGVDGTQALIAAVLVVDEAMINSFSIATSLATVDNLVLLAPTNSAFETFLNLEPGFLNGLSVDAIKAALPGILDGLSLTAADVSSVLLLHVGQSESASSEQLLAAKSVTVAGSAMPLPVSLGAKGVQVNYKSAVIKPDVTASNGAIHYIDTVITP